MRLNFTSILASASIFTGVWAAATPPTTVDIEERGLLGLDDARAPKLSAGAALDIVNKLQSRLTPIEKSINKTAHSISKSSPEKKRNQAIASAKKDLKDMAQAVYEAMNEVSVQARKPGQGGGNGGGGASVQALADALRKTLVTAAGTVNTLLASLGLTPLLAFLTPVTASLSGLVITLIPVVDSLLPILNVVLDGVVTGLSGLLSALIL